MNKAALSLAVAVILCVLGLQYHESTHGHSVLDFRAHTAKEPIKIGVLHSLVGTMAESEKPVVDAVMLAVDEINADGGLLGRELQAVLADGRSDLPTFEREAERLISEEAVSAVFGCWTSACRKTVKPVFERHNHLLFYSLQYEGLEQSPNIVYTGAAPNQQIIPAVRWSIDNIGKRLFLVGSDYVFPRAANAIIRDQAASADADIVGESYIPLGSNDVEDVIATIVEVQPDVILSTVNGGSSEAFLRALRAAGIQSHDIPTVSFSLGENELQHLNTALTAGDYASWTYFQSLPTEFNRRFVQAFQQKFGSRRVTSDPMVSAYSAVHLWASAVRTAGSAETVQVRESLPGKTLAAPQGPVAVDRHNHHLWKSVYIGQVQNHGQFNIVWQSGVPVKPVPYPSSRSQADWDGMLEGLFEYWGQSWLGASS